MATITLDCLEQKLLEAYEVSQRQSVIEQLRSLGVPAADLEATAARVIAAKAATHAADLRERLPREMRTAYLDRRHWLPVPCPMSELEAAIEATSAKRAAELLAEMTVADIIEDLQGLQLIVYQEGESPNG